MMEEKQICMCCKQPIENKAVAVSTPHGLAHMGICADYLKNLPIFESSQVAVTELIL